MINLKLLDYYYRLKEACNLAEELGYWLNYMDGGCCEERYFKEMYHKINKLTKTNHEKEWPEIVQHYFTLGYNAGRVESFI